MTDSGDGERDLLVRIFSDEFVDMLDTDRVDA